MITLYCFLIGNFFLVNECRTDCRSNIYVLYIYKRRGNTEEPKEKKKGQIETIDLLVV